MVPSTHSGLDNVVAEIGRALEDGNVDAVVRCLFVAIGDPLGKSRKKRETTMCQAFDAVKTLLQRQHVPLAPGFCDDESQPAADGFELSYPQLQMFALHKLEPKSTAYNIVRAVEVTNTSFNELALHRTCCALMAKHDVLRTCFDSDMYGQPRQYVRPVCEFVKSGDGGTMDRNSAIRVRTLNVIEDNVTRLAESIVQAISEPFDLSCQAPIRVYAFTRELSSSETNNTTQEQKKRQKWVLAVVLHHICTDPTSSSLFWRDLTKMYTHFVNSSVNLEDSTADAALDAIHRLDTTAARSVQYRDYAKWQRDRVQSGLLTLSLQYWVHHLSGELPVLELPLDTVSPIPAAHGNILTETEQSTADTIVFQSTPELQAQFTTFCTKRGASLFMGLLAVFQILLSRLSNCDDIVIGAPVSGRGGHDALETVMGYFVNTLPLRIRSQPDSSFERFLASVRDIVLGAFAHMEVPFQTILEHIAAVPRHSEQQGRQNPLFQVMFAWESSEPVTERSADSNAMHLDEIALPPHSPPKFDLMLSMRYALDSHGRKVLEGVMEYPVALFARDTVARFTEYFLQLLSEVMARPHMPMCAIQMIPNDEQCTLLHEWGTPFANRPQHPEPKRISENAMSFVDDCISQQVLETPENVALHFEGVEWTYSQLWSHSDQLRKALDAMLPNKSAISSTRIGLFLDRGLETAAAIVAVWRLRAVFVPLDTAFPIDRIKYMIADSQLQVIVSQRRHEQTLVQMLRGPAPNPQAAIAATSVQLLFCEDIHMSATDEIVSTKEDIPVSEQQCENNDAAHQVATDLTPHDTIAYILYTSGSTGNPKGVMVTHANLLTTLRWTIRAYDVDAHDVFLQSTSSTLDGSLTQLFSPLLRSARAVITKANGLHDLSYMQHVLTAHGITFCVFVPSYFALLIEFLPVFPASVKHVVLAGESFPMALAKKFYAKVRSQHQSVEEGSLRTCLVNEYGPTEASITSTWYRLPYKALVAHDGTIASLQSVPIGRPIDDHFVAILDAHKRLVPVNVPGELYVSGHGVAKGYWNRPDLTEKSFINLEELHVAFRQSSLPASMRWYKTGDRVKWLASGELLFLGRTDAQVKLRGMRIELHEIRNALLSHSAVQDAEVLVLSQQQMLVGFVLLSKDESDPDRDSQSRILAALRAFVSDRLPSHMVPQEFRIVTEWPRTPNGKLDLRALANLASTHSSSNSSVSPSPTAFSSSPQVPPVASESHEPVSVSVRIATEILKQAWGEVLGVDEFKDHDRLLSASFFELGGNSLLAIRVMSLVKTHGLTLPLDAFFRCPTLGDMAKRAASTLGGTLGSGALLPSLSASKALVPLNWKQTARTATSPLFLVHCADGTVWQLLELARQLPFPVIGIQQTATAAATQSAVDSIEALAKMYWHEIRAMQPRGPYALGGFSFGCRVAHEVARLAHAEGHELHPLTLLDGLPCSAPGPDEVASDEAHKQRETASTVDLEAYVEATYGYKCSSARGNDEDNGDGAILAQLGAQYLANCKLDTTYQPYVGQQSVEVTPEFESRSATEKKLWLRVHLIKIQQWDVDPCAFDTACGIAITTMDVPGASHETLLRPPYVDDVATAISTAYCDSKSGKDDTQQVQECARSSSTGTRRAELSADATAPHFSR